VSPPGEHEHGGRGDLADRTAVLRAVLDDALVTWGRSRSASWEIQVRAASDRLARAAESGGAADLLEAAEPVGASLSVAASEEGLPAELTSALREAIEFVRELRALALEAVVRDPVVPSRPVAAVDGLFRASVGVPTAHSGLVLPSPDVLPTVVDSDATSTVAAELGALAQRGALVRGLPETGEDDDDDGAERDDGRNAVAPRGEKAQLARFARDCMEDIAILSGLRRARDEDAWGDAERFDKRLLANLDALVSLDLPRSKRGTKLGVVSSLWRHATEWSVPDIGRAFAFAFVLSCLDTPDAIRWVMLALRRAPERVHIAFEDALALGSNPAIDDGLRDLASGETRPELLALALRVIRRRGAADVPSLMPLLAHPDREIARAAVWTLSPAPREEIEAPLVLLLEGDLRVSIAAARVLSAAGSQDAVRHLRTVLRRATSEGGDFARTVGLDAAIALSVMGEARDSEALAAIAGVQPALLPWLGVHGFASHLPTLWTALERHSVGEDGRNVARAIHRITGLHPAGWRPADRTDLIAISWQDILATAPEWPTTRLRFGRQHVAGSRGGAAVLDELAEGSTLQGDRRRLAAELYFAMGRSAALDIDGWTVRQLARLGELGRVTG